MYKLICFCVPSYVPGQKIVIGISPDKAVALTESGSVISSEVLQSRMFANQTYLAVEVEVMKVKTSTSTSTSTAEKDKEKDRAKIIEKTETETEIKVQVAEISNSSVVPERKNSEPNIVDRMKKVAGPFANTQLAGILSGASATSKSNANLTHPTNQESSNDTPQPLSSSTGQVNPLKGKEKSTKSSAIEKVDTKMDKAADSSSSITTTMVEVTPDTTTSTSTIGTIGLGQGSASWGVVTQLQLMQQAIATVQQSMIQLHSKVCITERYCSVYVCIVRMLFGMYVFIHVCLYIYIFAMYVCMYVCMHVCTYILYVCMYIYVYICVYLYVYIYLCIMYVFLVLMQMDSVSIMTKTPELEPARRSYNDSEVRLKSGELVTTLQFLVEVT